MRAELKAYEYSFRIHWSPADRGYVASVAEWPAIASQPTSTPHAALQAVIPQVIRELKRCDAEDRPRPPVMGVDVLPASEPAAS